MDPWSKVDYSRIIWEASMVVEKLLKVNPPSDKVQGRGLLVLPILEARRRRNRGEIAKKGYVLGGFGMKETYRRRGQPGGPPGVQAAPQRGPNLVRATWPSRHQEGPLWPLFGTL